MSSLRAIHLVLPASLAATAAVLVGAPTLLGDRIGPALAELRGASPLWLWAGLALLGAMHAATALAWRAALSSCGTSTTPTDAIARYAVGAGVNAITPFRLGSALRVGLFARLVRCEGGLWQVGGAAAAAGALRAAWFSLLVAGAAAAGAVPWWPVLLFGGIGAIAAAAAAASRRLDLRSRIGRSLDVFRELGRSPRALATVAGYTGAALAAKVGAATAVAAAMGVDRPLLAGMLVVPAVELAAILPLLPGNMGVASAAVAFALQAHGTAAGTALAAGLAYGALEPIAALALGGVGAFGLFGPQLVPQARLAAAATGTLGLVGLFGATVLLPL